MKSPGFASGQRALPCLESSERRLIQRDDASFAARRLCLANLKLCLQKIHLGPLGAPQLSVTQARVAEDNDRCVEAWLWTLPARLQKSPLFIWRERSAQHRGALGSIRTSSAIALHSRAAFIIMRSVDTSMLIVRFDAPSFWRIPWYLPMCCGEMSASSIAAKVSRKMLQVEFLNSNVRFTPTRPVRGHPFPRRYRKEHGAAGCANSIGRLFQLPPTLPLRLDRQSL